MDHGFVSTAGLGGWYSTIPTMLFVVRCVSQYQRTPRIEEQANAIHLLELGPRCIVPQNMF